MSGLPIILLAMRPIRESHITLFDHRLNLGLANFTSENSKARRRYSYRPVLNDQRFLDNLSITETSLSVTTK